MKSSGKENRTPQTNENVRNYPDRTLASLTLPLMRTVSLHDPRIKITWKAQTDKQESAARTFVYTDFWRRSSDQAPEWRDVHQTWIAVAWENLWSEGVQWERDCEREERRCVGEEEQGERCAERKSSRGMAMAKHGEQGNRGTGQIQIPGFQETVGPNPSQLGPLCRTMSHSAWCVFFLFYWFCPMGRGLGMVSEMGQSLAVN